MLDPGHGDISGTLEGTPAKSETSGPADSAQPGADLPGDAFEAASSWVNWSDEEDFYLAALNADKLAVSSAPGLFQGRRPQTSPPCHRCRLPDSQSP